MYKVATFLVNYFWDKPSKSTDRLGIADGLGVLLLTWNNAFYRYGPFDFEKLEKCIIDNLPKIEEFRSRPISTLSSSDNDSIKQLFIEFLSALQIDIIRFSDKNTKKYAQKQLTDLLLKLGVKYRTNGNLRSLYDSIKDDQKIKDALEFIDEKRSNSKKSYVVIKISKLTDRQQKIVESSKLIMRSPVAVAKALHLLAPEFFPPWDNKIARKGYQCNYAKNPAEKYLTFCQKMKTMESKIKNCADKPSKLIKLIDEYNYSKYTQGWI